MSDLEDIETVMQNLTRATELLSRMHADGLTESENPIEDSSVLSQDEMVQRLKPMRLLVVAKECDIAYATLNRLYKGEQVHRRTLKVVSDYLIEQAREGVNMYSGRAK